MTLLDLGGHRCRRQRWYTTTSGFVRDLYINPRSRSPSGSRTYALQVCDETKTTVPMSETSPVVFTEAWLPGSVDHQFYTRTYTGSDTPRGIILFVHGFAEHIVRYEDAHRTWAARSFKVFAYDQRGFGRTALDTEHRSKEAAYGKISHRDLLQDLEFWVRRLHAEHTELPLFLVGHSMGGGLAFIFVTPRRVRRSDTVQMVSGVVDTKPVSKITRAVAGRVATYLPHLHFPAGIPLRCIMHDLSRDPALLGRKGTLRGLSDMLNAGEQLLWTDWKNWPTRIPVLFLHGTGDKVTSHKATEDFFMNIAAEDKKLILFPDAYHELAFEGEEVREKVVEDCVVWISTGTIVVVRARGRGKGGR
ncbi:Alpha/Beta hydrolase protein [Amylocystis lapponica]|nr:Alpha/Beta hydrolase protein [Amylocystis lapponica]